MSNLIDNVRMVLDTNYQTDIPDKMIENNWEILNVVNMNTFVFPQLDDDDYNAAENTKGGKKCWCPQNIDIAIVFKKIYEANYNGTDISSIRNPFFIKPKDWFSKNQTEGMACRPCGFLTPRETIMPMMLIPTAAYIQNGITLVKEEADKYKVNLSFAVDPKIYKTCFNWFIPLSYTDGSNKYNKLSAYGKREITQEKFTFINSSTCLQEDENKVISTRRFTLYETPNNIYYKLPSSYDSVVSEVVDESLIFGEECGAFALAYRFHGEKTGENEEERSRIMLNIGTTFAVVNIPKEGNLEVTIGKNKTDGSVKTAKNSQKMGQLTEMNGGEMLIFYPVWNGIAISGGIDDASRVKDSKGTINVTVDNGFIAKINNDTEMSDFCFPNQKTFNTKNPSPMEVKTKSQDGKTSVTINCDSFLSLSAINCTPAFAYTPVFFQKNLKFSLYIRDNYGKDILTEIGDEISSETPTRTHYLYPIYYQNGTSYKVDKKVKGTKIVLLKKDNPEAEEDQIFYRFDFEFCAPSYQRRGIEIFGFFHQVKSTGKKREMRNNNGIISLNSSDSGYAKKFNESYSYQKILESNWIEYATEINVNRSNTQSGGTINLDKYAFLGQFENPTQPVGEVRLKAIGGNNGVYINPQSVYFTGIGIGISYNDTPQSDVMTLNLSGIEKKLQDIKLAGSPYFDGDPANDVMLYLSQYANFHYEFANVFTTYSIEKETGVVTPSSQDLYYPPSWMSKGVAPCPRSVEFQRPSINFLLGTTVYEAINQVCQKTNKTWFITKEGIVRIIDQNVYGIPVNIVYSLVNKTPSLKLDSSQILNISLQPYTDNVYNQVVTASLKGKRMGNDTPILPDPSKAPVMPNVMYSKIEYSNIKFPWSKMIVSNELAILSEEETKKVHAINTSQFACATFTGSLTIPGNAALEIFDTVSIDDNPEIFYITNINHSYSSSSRVWTTSLQVTHLDSSCVKWPYFNQLTTFLSDPNPRD